MKKIIIVLFVLIFLLGCIQQPSSSKKGSSKSLVDNNVLGSNLEENLKELNINAELNLSNEKEPVLNFNQKSNDIEMLKKTAKLFKNEDIDFVKVTFVEEEVKSEYLVNSHLIELYNLEELGDDELFIYSVVNLPDDELLDSRKENVVKSVYPNELINFLESYNSISMDLQINQEFSDSRDLPQIMLMMATFYFDKETYNVKTEGKTYTAKYSDLEKFLYKQDVDLAEVYEVISS